MSIHQRILIITITLTLLSVVVLTVVSNTLFLKPFRQLEESLLRDDLSRASEAIERELHYLESTAADWAYWDETHRFLLGTNPGYTESNLSLLSLKSLGVNVMLFYDPALNRFYQISVHPITPHAIPLPVDMDQQIHRHLFNDMQLDSHYLRSGILPTAYGPMLVAARAILKNDGAGQPAGVFIIGTYLNELTLDEWRQATRLAINVYPLDDPRLPAEVHQSGAGLNTSPEPVLILNLDQGQAQTQEVSGYTRLTAINGEPYLLLEVQKEPAVYASGVQNFRLFLVFILLFGVLVGGFAWLSFNRSISSRLFSIIRTINRFRETRDFTISLPLRGNDELTRLSIALSQLISEMGRYHHTLAASERQFRELLQKLELIAVILDRQGRVVFCNEYLVRLSGWDWQNILQSDWFALFAQPNERGRRRERFDHFIQQETIQHSDESVILTRDGEKRLIAWSNTFIRKPDGTINGMARIGQDITEHRKNEEKLRQNLKETSLLLSRLNTLREIDSTIIGDQSSAEKITTILAVIKRSLEVDAVNLLTESIPGILVPSATIGFNLAQIPPVQISAGRDNGGGLNPDSVLTLNHLQQGNIPDWLAGRFYEHLPYNFYAVAPMTIEGRRYGIIEVFSRGAFKPDQEWQHHFQTLANQAAIALDHSQMILDIQRANREMKDAYEATIQGWSATLEMRDKETQGHSERMLDLSQRLGRRLGLNENQLTDLRYGVLLHDIGKMAVPDSILNKPGALTEAEWEIMRQHPQYAYNLLSGVSFLRGAMDVIYCHHERWDGSGYPQGLSGERIPLSARIFAIVDIWDALTNDRPYRAAWSNEKALHYLEQQAGLELDPRVVQAFVAMLREQEDAIPQALRAEAV